MVRKAILLPLPIHLKDLRSCGSGEMADTQVLGTCVFGRAGSSPASRTQCYDSRHRGQMSPVILDAPIFSSRGLAIEVDS